MNKLRTVTLAAALLVASVPSLSTTAQARPFGSMAASAAVGATAVGATAVGAAAVGAAVVGVVPGSG
jgi:hypothetical protein